MSSLPLVKTHNQFRESRSENCSLFKMEEDHERVTDCTTPNLTGQINIFLVATQYTLAVSEALSVRFGKLPSICLSTLPFSYQVSLTSAFVSQ
ncbi:unnamed protein product [Lactuca virosa]|uniref:Spt4/RpoE2 zinc finger domain-containing protein n=1 Tax=Lactuca virosa TaxID=75947 RepID=A0AAU9NRJ1_9ASTR|nr:unnamed protein product [Lactuca virosa]